jgi:3-dehydroquinate synthase
MVKVNINLGERSYPIHITSDYKGFGKSISTAKLTGKLVVVTDTNVDKHQVKVFMEALESSGLSADKFVIPAGETNKNLDTVREIYKFLLSLKLDRNSTLIALGGGVVGDITGFVAATFLRGINFIQVPTTSLAQADSSVGGKVGVDFEGAKNVIGAFYQPKFVYMNVSTLKTLPKRDMISGLAEVVKHGIISDSEFFEFIDYNVKKIFNFDNDVLQYLAKVNCSIKGRIVEQDEKESGLRKNLNFGHTIGHAIESVSNFDLMHGECVSIGMVGAFRMARRLEMIGDDTVNKVINTLEKIGLPVRLHSLNVENVYKQMFYDKKIENNKLLFILPKAIGEVVQVSIDDEKLIKRVLADLV